MHVNLDSGTEARLTSIAAASGRDAEILAREAIERFIEHDEWFVREVEVGIAAADRGDLMSHEEVGARVESLLERQRRRV